MAITRFTSFTKEERLALDAALCEYSRSLWACHRRAVEQRIAHSDYDVFLVDNLRDELYHKTGFWPNENQTES